MSHVEVPDTVEVPILFNHTELQVVVSAMASIICGLNGDIIGSIQANNDACSWLRKLAGDDMKNAQVFIDKLTAAHDKQHELAGVPRESRPEASIVMPHRGMSS